MADIILHHYDRSPFSEKVRLAFGVKGLSWRSVQVPRLMPKPDLLPLTGGYRKAPVMQIGADIYCDTRCILREIERRFPEPALYGADGGEMVAAWADSTLFTTAVGVIFGTFADMVPKEMKDDRRAFTGGLWDADQMKREQPLIRDQFAAELRLVEQSLGDGRPYIAGTRPGIADLAAYHPLWFVSGNLREPDLLAECAKTKAWMARMAAIGHGAAAPLDAKEALRIAAQSRPASVAPGAAGRWRPGERVAVAANDYGRDPVLGELLRSDAETIVLRRHDPQAGELNLHFPALGFDVTAA